MSDCKNCHELRRQNEALQSKVTELKAFIESIESEVQSERNRNAKLVEALKAKDEALRWFLNTYEGKALSTAQHGCQNVLVKALTAQPELTP